MTHSILYQVVQLNEAEAMKLFKTEWWVNITPEEAAFKQLFTNIVIMPIDQFTEGLTQLLKRRVSVGEVANRIHHLRQEYLGLEVRPEYEMIKAADEAILKGVLVQQVLVEVDDERE
jgi:hypothetical protein